MRQSPAVITACLIGIALALLGLIFGVWLPYRKAQEFISAERRSSRVRTVDDFKANFDLVFDFYSPVGDEEVTKFLAGNMLGIVHNQDEAVARALVEYIEPKLFQDEVRHLMIAGQFRQSLWQNFGQEEDYLASVGYYQKAHEIGPNLPTPLYALLGMYKTRGDLANMERIAREILQRWPDDANIRALFE